MASSARPTPGAELVGSFRQMREKESKLDEQFHYQEQQDREAFEAAKRAIEEKAREERESFLSQLPGQNTLPEAFEKFVNEKRDISIAKAEQEYDRRRAERADAHEKRRKELRVGWVKPHAGPQLNLRQSPTYLHPTVGNPQPAANGNTEAQAAQIAAAVFHQRNVQQRYAAPPPVVLPRQPEVVSTSQTPTLQRPFATSPPVVLPHQPEVVSFQSAPSTTQQESVVLRAPGTPVPITEHVQAAAPQRTPLPTRPHAPRPPAVEFQRSNPPPQREGPTIPGHHTPVPGLKYPPQLASQPIPPQPLPGSSVSRPVLASPDSITVHGPARHGVPPETQITATGVRTIVEPPSVQTLGIAESGTSSQFDSAATQQRPVTPAERREPLSDIAGRAINQLTSSSKSPKRKADSPTPAEVPKRAKVEDPADPGVSPRRRKKNNGKTISFDEVYQNGNPKYSHIIVEHPAQSSMFYILKCEEHGVHFNLNPLHGAAKHLHSQQHNFLSKERNQAVELLGYLVEGCNRELMEKNNDAVKAAFANGYKVFNLNQMSKTARRSLGIPSADSTGSTTQGQSAPAKKSANKPIVDPVPGQLYLALWPDDCKRYPVMILPWGSLKCAGMPGSLSDTGLLQGAPKCYVIDRITGQIQGWAPGFGDGESQATKREFPVVYFDGRTSVGWVRAKDLSMFNFDDPGWRDIPMWVDAGNHFARLRGFESLASMKAAAAGRDLRTFHAQPDNQTTDSYPDPPAVQLTPVGAAAVSTAHSGDHDMVDAGPAQGDDSDRDSVSKDMDDSDVEMSNMESRRTSVSNRGESDSLNDKNTAGLRIAAQLGDAQAPNKVSPASESFPGQNPSHQPPSVVVQIHPSEAQQQGGKSPMGATFPGNISGQSSRKGSTASTEQPHRRVEKIYAHSNPNRVSKSPGIPAQMAARVPSPVSLQHILPSQPIPGYVPPRPAPLAQQTPVAVQAHTQRAPSPAQQRAPSAEATSTSNSWTPGASSRGSELAKFPSPMEILGRPEPSPTASQAGSEQRQSRSASSTPAPTLNPPSRKSTPVILMGNEAASLSDRWRALHNVGQPASTPAHSPSPPASKPNGFPPISVSRPGTEVQQIPSPLTPTLNQGDSRSASPSVASASIKAESTSESAMHAGEVFGVSLFTNVEDQEKTSEVFRLTVDGQTKTAKTDAAAPLQFTVNPMKIKQLVVGSAPYGGSSDRAVQMVMEGNKWETLIFEAFDAGRGKLAGVNHARRFTRWVKSVNPAAEYQNTSIVSGRQPGQTPPVVTLD